MTEAILDAVDVVKFLGSGPGRVEALRGVSLTVTGGELTLLMGPSGSGKTTLLSILGCMLSPTSGTVRIAGRSTAGAGPEDLAKLRREHIGFVFQSYHLFPTMSALDNVRLALDVRGEGARASRAKAKEAMATVGLAHKAKSYPSELSGGEQQRVAIARAIVGEPALLLADEPTGNLDPQLAVDILGLLEDINETGVTVLFATHDRSLLDVRPRRVVVLDEGKATDVPHGLDEAGELAGLRVA
jgi:putative ABC transport system ATP-binding protein